MGSEEQARRESLIAEKLGVKGAEERNMKQRAAKLKEDGIGTPELERRAKAGDIAAAYRLAEDGKLEGGVLKDIMGRTKNEHTRGALLNKVGEKRMDATLQYKLEANNKLDATDPNKKNWSNIEDVARDQYKNLTAEGWAKQKNLSKQFRDVDVYNGATDAFASLKPGIQAEAIKHMDGKNSEALT